MTMYRSMCIRYACIGSHSAVQCFIEFKRARDLWTEFNIFLNFFCVFWSIGFLRLNLLEWFWVLFMYAWKNHVGSCKIFYSIANTTEIVKRILVKVTHSSCL